MKRAAMLVLALLATHSWGQAQTNRTPTVSILPADRAALVEAVRQARVAGHSNVLDAPEVRRAAAQLRTAQDRAATAARTAAALSPAVTTNAVSSESEVRK